MPLYFTDPTIESLHTSAEHNAESILVKFKNWVDEESSQLLYLLLKWAMLSAAWVGVYFITTLWWSFKPKHVRSNVTLNTEQGNGHEWPELSRTWFVVYFITTPLWSCKALHVCNPCSNVTKVAQQRTSKVV